MMGKAEHKRRTISTRRWIGRSALAGSVLGLFLVSGGASCGGTATGGGLLIDSNTNWLQRCGPEVPCAGALLCLCGMCSQPCAASAECGLLEGATCGGSCGEAAPSGGGMCVLACISSSECGEGFVCEASECRPEPAKVSELPLGDVQVPTDGPCTNAFVSEDNLFAAAHADLAAQDADDRQFIRYVSFANRFNAGACAPELGAERDALVKLLNSTSMDASITLPAAVDSGRVLYRIDLRDYGWDRPLRVGENDYGDSWEAITLGSPYGIEFEGPEADVMRADTGATVPLMQADAFVYAAGREETYMALIDLPETRDDLLLELGIDVDANRRDGQARRAATTKSRISRLDRIIERHEIEVRAGVFWMTLDFDDSNTLGTSFAQPLRTESDGGVITFSLPNGLPAFAVYDQGGQLVPDSDILLDTSQNNFRALTAVSCMS
jgi:hypothetical protein